MKNLFCAFVLISALTIVCAQETFKFPGMKCTDTVLLEKQLALAPEGNYKVILTAMVEYSKNPPQSFDEAKTVMFAAADSLNRSNKLEKDYFIKQYVLHTHQWLDELGAYCLDNPGTYDANIAIRGYEQKKPWAKQMLVNMLTKYTLNPTKCIQCIDVLIEYNLSNEITNAEAKDILTKLDIRYTNQLANDKPKWEPVVTKIRTLLERYN
ncbi:MAG: hypothetical protein ACOX7D_04285 [Alphaproteobacteria bacterium]|jgi:hypothetical protein